MVNRLGRSWIGKVQYLLGAVALSLMIWFALFMVLKVHPYPLWLLSISVVTFLLFVYDKIRARRKGGRVPELTLHALSLLGGFIGGWMGMLIVRHKTRHPSFYIVQMISTIIHGAFILRSYIL